MLEQLHLVTRLFSEGTGTSTYMRVYYAPQSAKHFS